MCVRVAEGEKEGEGERKKVRRSLGLIMRGQASRGSVLVGRAVSLLKLCDTTTESEEKKNLKL